MLMFVHNFFQNWNRAKTTLKTHTTECNNLLIIKRDTTLVKKKNEDLSLTSNRDVMHIFECSKHISAIFLTGTDIKKYFAIKIHIKIQPDKNKTGDKQCL